MKEGGGILAAIAAVVGGALMHAAPQCARVVPRHADDIGLALSRSSDDLSHVGGFSAPVVPVEESAFALSRKENLTRTLATIDNWNQPPIVEEANVVSSQRQRMQSPIHKSSAEEQGEHRYLSMEEFQQKALENGVDVGADLFQSYFEECFVKNESNLCAE